MSQRAIASTGLMGGIVNAARLVGGLLLGFLFLVVPSYNPAVLNTGSERLYVGGVLVLAAATTAVVPLFAARAWWVLAAASFAALYVLEGAVRTHHSFNVIANAYRPLQPIVAYCACALLLTPERRGRWLMLLLAGGAIGSTLAALHTFVPGFDPFSVSRPSQPFISEYGSGLGSGLRRETGAFAYPNNLGTYCAYIAVIGLTVMPTKRDRKVLILLGLVVAPALTGLFVSGARAALLGFLAGAVVLAWGRKHIRPHRPLASGRRRPDRRRGDVAVASLLRLAERMARFPAFASVRRRTVHRDDRRVAPVPDPSGRPDCSRARHRYVLVQRPAPSALRRPLERAAAGGRRREQPLAGQPRAAARQLVDWSGRVADLVTASSTRSICRRSRCGDASCACTWAAARSRPSVDASPTISGIAFASADASPARRAGHSRTRRARRDRRYRLRSRASLPQAPRRRREGVPGPVDGMTTASASSKSSRPSSGETCPR